METNRTLVIDLNAYGYNALMEMGKPSLRQIRDMRNRAGRAVKRMEGQTMYIEMDMGDMMIQNVLSYVKTAPFALTVDGFLDFCDEIDAKNPGEAEKLMEEMQKKVEQINGGATSPFEDSLVQTIQNLV